MRFHIIPLGLKAMKGRVRPAERSREPRQLKRGAENRAEDGPGAAHRARERKAAMGAPITASGYACTCRGLLREKQANQGGIT